MLIKIGADNMSEKKKVTPKKQTEKKVAAKKTTKTVSKATTVKQTKKTTPKLETKKVVKVEKTPVKKGLGELRKRQILLITGILALVLLLCFGLTYVWIVVNQREEAKRPKTGFLSIAVNDSTTSSLVMENPYPMNETGGLSTDPYKLTLENESKYIMNYALVLKEDEDALKKCAEENDGVECKKVSIDSLRYSIKKNGGVLSTGLLKDSKGVIEMGMMEPTSDENDTKVDYELKLWVDYDTTEDLTDAKFYGKVDVLVQIGE